MKTIFTCLLLLSGAAYSQRSANLIVTITSPASPLVIETEEVYTLDISIENQGPDAITEEDTLKFTMTINGETVMFPPQGDYLIYQEAIASGETVSISRVSAFDDSYDNSEFPMCVRIVPVNAADFVIDDTLTNNVDCISVQIGSQLGTDENTALSGGVYPNPAKDVFYVENTAGARVIVSDAAGNEVYGIELNEGKVDCSDWESGIYFVTVVSGENSSTRRIAVLR